MATPDEPLADGRCIPCRKGAVPLSGEESDALLARLPGWRRVEREGVALIERSFDFPDFAAALAFTDAVGAAAEDQDHHPAILTEWGRVTVRWWTHRIRGLHRNDFIMAARTDRIFEERGEEHGDAPG